MSKMRQIFSFANVGPWLLVPALLLAFLLGRLVSGGGSDAGHASHAESSDEASQRWTCSMHPQIILPSNDQKCPICFMDLIPLEDNGQEGLNPEDLALSAAGIALAGIETNPVERRFVAHRIPLVGKVVYDESKVHNITARYGGRLDKLYVNSPGEQVKKGSRLADIYSPELYGVQVELQAAIRSSEAGTPGAKNMVRAARQRLLLLGFDRAQIDKLAHKEQQDTHLAINAPAGGVVVSQNAIEGMYVKTGSLLYSIADLSSLWITLEAFESDLPWLKVGQNVPFTMRSQPGQEFSAVIDFIEPVLDKRTNAVIVRLLVDNADGQLMPGMLVSAHVEVVLDEWGHPVDAGSIANPPLVIPATAVLQAGVEAMVYVKKAGAEGVFSGRKVQLGPRAGDYYLVLGGLEFGEEVVVRGSFKIDSALQIMAHPSMMALLPDHGQNEEVNNVHHAGTTLAGPQEFRNQLSELLDRYMDLQTFLAGDDGQASRGAASDFSLVLAQIQELVPSLTVAENMAWSEHHAVLNKSSLTIARTEGIEAQRMAFQPLSDNLWELLAAFGNPDSRVVRHINCPMAMDGDGANWLQFDKTVANPYYGSTMLRCGSEFEALAVGDSP